MTPPPSPTCHHHLLSNFEVLPCIVARNVTLLRSHWGSIARCREALPRLMGADLGPENRRGLQGRCPKLEVPCTKPINSHMWLLNFYPLFIHGIWSFNFFDLVCLSMWLFRRTMTLLIVLIVLWAAQKMHQAWELNHALSQVLGQHFDRTVQQVLDQFLKSVHKRS